MNSAAARFKLLFFSRHNVLQISEPDYLCLRLNKEFSSVFHLMRCQSRSLWCYNYYGNKKVKNSQKNATWSEYHLILSQILLALIRHLYWLFLSCFHKKELFYSVMLILRRENKLYFCDQLEVSCGQSSDLFLVALHLYIEAPVITIGHARNISWKHLQVWIIFFSSQIYGSEHKSFNKVHIKERFQPKVATSHANGSNSKSCLIFWFS